MTEQNIYEAGLDKSPANFEELTPSASWPGRRGSIPTIRR